MLNGEFIRSPIPPEALTCRGPERARTPTTFVRVKKIGGYEYLYLVENVREGGRHVQRVIKAIGRRDEVESSGLLDNLIASAARHSRRLIVLFRFYRGELAEIRHRSIGPGLAFGHLWRQTGCQAVLRRRLAGRRSGFDAERAIYLRVLHRLMVSGSDCHASTWQQTLDIARAKDLIWIMPTRSWPGWAGGDRGRGQRTDASSHRCHRRGVV